MNRLRAYKTELDPNNEQRTMFHKCAGAARFVFNWALADRKEKFEKGEKTGLYEQKRRFNSIKVEQFPWITEIPYRTQEEAFRNLDLAFKNFFRRVKNGETPGYPKFKSKSKGIGAFTLRAHIHVEEKRIKLPVIGWVRLKEKEYLPQKDVKILFANISERAGRWFVSLQVEEDVPDPDTPCNPPIGMDLGIKSLAVLSDGTVFDNPKSHRQAEKNLKRLQRELSRREKSGANYKKTKKKLAKAYAKVGNIRRHTLHQISHSVVEKKPRAIVMEELNVAGMVKNHHLAQAISDASFNELRRQITYKSVWNGIKVKFADQWMPSSKKCSCCGNVKTELTLADRIYTCDNCGLIIDRDLNAAINLAACASEG